MHRPDTSRYRNASWRQSMALAERIVLVEDALQSLRSSPICCGSSYSLQSERTSATPARGATDACVQLVHALEHEAHSYRAYYRSSLEHWLSGNEDECYPLDLAHLSTLSPDHRSALQRVLSINAQHAVALRRSTRSRRRSN